MRVGIAPHEAAAAVVLDELVAAAGAAAPVFAPTELDELELLPQAATASALTSIATGTCTLFIPTLSPSADCGLASPDTAHVGATYLIASKTKLLTRTSAAYRRQLRGQLATVEARQR
jgi:hypothetical protein